MQCQCGGETQQSKAVIGALKARIEFLVCRSCTRVGCAELFVREVSVARDTGEEMLARRLFQTLSAESADELYAAVMTRQQPAGDAKPEQAALF